MRRLWHRLFGHTFATNDRVIRDDGISVGLGTIPSCVDVAFDCQMVCGCGESYWTVKRYPLPYEHEYVKTFLERARAATT